MSGLVLKLGPKERVLVNGAVIENGCFVSLLLQVLADDGGKLGFVLHDEYRCFLLCGHVIPSAIPR